MSASRILIVNLARSKLKLTVPPERSILNVLLAEKIHIRHACHTGQCGACEVKVLSGVPEHLDSVYRLKLNPPYDRMKVCVSRAFTSELTLDI